ncbi:MAG: tRNA 2-thiouridine(34) synthase MnmA, partial [Smithellaceae bacterium]|nr:tRNA 2-thiouridine(34) synthase MnmA [Smithellaceae bacterium]
ALLLQREGWTTAGITMCLGVTTAEGDARCCGPDAIEGAKRVCCVLGIPHYVSDFAASLEEEVIGRFVAEYRRGRTPNPCVDCNRYLKFGLLLEKARALGFDYLATGHYATIEGEDDNFMLTRAKDRQKDQTYFLYAIGREDLGSILFPLAPYRKAEVRELAREAKLPAAEKKESQDICFVTEGSYGDFVAGRLQDIKPGPIVDLQGRAVGEHRGVVFYTIGQRGGLRISAPEPSYVVAIDVAKNRIVVGKKDDLLSRELIAGDLNLLATDWPSEIAAKIRYRKREAPCTAEFARGKLKLVFTEAQEAITPGQSVVCYDGDRVLGGGIIEEVIK